MTAVIPAAFAASRDYVQREVGFHTVLPAYSAYFRKVFHPEIVCGVRPHVQFFHSEVDGVRSALDGSLKTFEIARRGHDFQLFPVHGHLFLPKSRSAYL